MEDEQSEFEELLIGKADKVGLSLLLVLAWISASDGDVDQQEKEDLYAIARAGSNSDAGGRYFFWFGIDSRKSGRHPLRSAGDVGLIHSNP